MQLVVVKFVDPATYGHWASMEEVEQSKCKVGVAGGFLLHRDAKLTKVGVLVSQGRDIASNWVVIDNESIISFDEIKEVDWETGDGS